MISIATDCSGIDAPIFAMKRLGIPIKHIFSSDIDKHARESIKKNCKPQHIYDNIVNSEPTHSDIYVCGFPCQSFSMAGKRLGFSDESRGNIFFECLKHIKKSKPKVFILENVKGLLNHDNGETFKIIINSLNKLKIYNVYWKVLNSKDFGIPHNRERIFIIGIRKDAQKNPFEFPKPKPNNCKTIEFILEKSSIAAKYKFLTPFEKNTIKHHQNVYMKKGLDIFKENYIIDAGASPEFSSIMKGICPCLKATRSNYYMTKYRRKLTPREVLRLQGFPDSFKIVVSDNQIYKQAGNSITVDVLAKLIKSILKSIKL